MFTKKDERSANRTRSIAVALTAIATIGTLPVFSIPAQAQSNWARQRQTRQNTKNTWRNLAIGAGGIGVLGALSHDPTVAILGAAGSLYSLNRYEQDRKSQSNSDRARAEIFSHPYFYRDGVRYDRQMVTRNGDRYYQFVRRDNYDNGYRSDSGYRHHHGY